MSTMAKRTEEHAQNSTRRNNLTLHNSKHLWISSSMSTMAKRTEEHAQNSTRRNNLTLHNSKHLWISSSTSTMGKRTVTNDLSECNWVFQKLTLDLERSMHNILLVVSMFLSCNLSCVQRTYVGLWRPNKH